MRNGAPEHLEPVTRLPSLDPEAIERALARLWADLAHGEAASLGPGGQGAVQPAQAVTRACALNLVAFVPSERGAAGASNAVATLTARHPSRAILLVQSPAAAGEAELEAEVTAMCRVVGAARSQVCCEAISLYARTPAATNRLAGVAASLLVPDLPVALWWCGPLPATGSTELGPGGRATAALFDRLIEVADRALIDSELGTVVPSPAVDVAAPTVLQELARRIEPGDGPVAWNDLAWARLAPWRELIASLFDPPRLADLLPAISRVVIDLPSARANPAAWLLLGWLASRLGWTPARPDGGADGSWRWRLARAGGHVEGTVTPAAAGSDGDPTSAGGEPRGVRLQAGGNGARQGEFSVRLQGDPAGRLAEITADTADGRVVERSVPLAARATGDLLADLLDQPGRDSVFEAAVRCAAQMLPPGSMTNSPVPSLS